MRMPRIRIGTLMSIVALIAIYLAAVRAMIYYLDNCIFPPILLAPGVGLALIGGFIAIRSKILRQSGVASNEPRDSP